MGKELEFVTKAELKAVIRMLRHEMSGKFTTGGGTGSEAIAFDAASCTNGNTNTLQWNHTCSGNHRILVVFAGCNPGQATISSVTYGGQNLTYLCRGDGTYRRLELWYLLDPPTGENSITINYSASTYVVGGAISFTGVSGIDNCNGNYESSVTSHSLSITGVSGDYWAVAAAMTWAYDITGGTGQTTRFNLTGSQYRTNGATDQDGSFSWTIGTAQTWGSVGARLIPLS